MYAKVSTVEIVRAVFLKSSPPTFHVSASGKVPTAGWSDGQLVPRIYTTPPPDGMWDFDFVAKAPTGIVPEVISPISASFSLFDPPKWVRGARVHASQNSADSASSEVTSRLVTFGPSSGGGSYGLLSVAHGGVDGFPW